MKYRTLTIDKRGRVALVSLIGPMNGQERLAELSQELDHVCQAFTWDEEIAVVVITGTGEQPFSIVSHQGDELWPLAEKLAILDTPVIAAAHGDVLGQGLEMLLACDVRLCATSARFGLPQIKEGLLPADGGTQRLSRIIGCAKAMELILTGETIDGPTALALGLVNRMEDAHRLTDEAVKLAKNVSRQAPIALRYGKEAINKGLDLTLEQGLRLEADLYFLLHTTHDRTEGITAFRQKKDPEFKGE